MLHLPTDEVVPRGRDISLPITQNVIDLVHILAIRDGMPTNLKITIKTRVTLFDAAWTARVEYNPQSQEDIEDNTDTDSSEAEEDLDEDYGEVDPNEVEDIN